MADKHIQENEHKMKAGGLFSHGKKTLPTFLAKERRYMDQFKLRHKITFAFLVFFGINLVWYGMWEIISDLPFIQNPIVALIIGAIILIITGYFYENLISASFGKPRPKKKTKQD